MSETDLLAAVDFRSRAAGWEPMDLRPVLEGHHTEPEPSMLLRSDGQGLIYPGKAHNFAGEPESGKGWLALQVCAERMGQEENVLYIDFEDTVFTAITRLRALGVPDEVIAKHFTYIAPQEPLAVEVASIVPEGCSIAVVDGVTEAMTLHGLKLLDNTDTATFLGMLVRPITATGAAGVLLDHVSRDREARGRGAIGAQHKLAGVDVSYFLDTIRPFGRGLDGLSRLTVTKDRPGFIRAASAGRKYAGEVELYSTGDDVAVVVKPMETVGKDDPLGLTPAQRRVLNALPSGPPGDSPQEIGDRVVEMGWEQGLHRVTIQNALTKLSKDGLANGAEGRWWKNRE